MQFSELQNTVRLCGVLWTCNWRLVLTYLCRHQLCPAREMRRTRRKYCALTDSFCFECPALFILFINQDVGPLIPCLGPVLCQLDNRACSQQ